MKKKFMTVMLMIVLAISMIACSQPMNEEEKIEADLMEYMQEEEASQQAAEAEREELEAQAESTKKYDVSDEWNSITDTACAIQIDDTVYYAGMTVRELNEKLMASDADYEFEINESQLVSGNKVGEISIKKAGTTWFTVQYKNFTEETVALSETVVITIAPKDCAINHVYFMGGYSKEDAAECNYSNIQDFIRKVFIENSNIPEENVVIEEKSVNHNGVDRICFSVCLNVEQAEGLLWTGYKASYEFDYYFYVSTETSEVYEMEIGSPYVDYVLYTELMSSEISDYEEQMDDLYQQVVAEYNETPFAQEYGMATRLYGAAIIREKGALAYGTEIYSEYNMMGLFIEVNQNGETKYIFAEIGRGFEDYFGNYIVEERFWINNGYSVVPADTSEEAYIQSGYKLEDIVSKSF